MVRIRLKRMGRRHRPFYRINAIEKRNQRDGVVLENLGWYDPMAKDADKQVLLKNDRIKHWLEHGAQPTDVMKDILVKHELYDADKLKAERQMRYGKKIERVKQDKIAADAAKKAEEEAARKAAEEEAKAKAAAEAAAAAEASESGEEEKSEG